MNFQENSNLYFGLYTWNFNVEFSAFWGQSHSFSGQMEIFWRKIDFNFLGTFFSRLKIGFSFA